MARNFNKVLSFYWALSKVNPIVVLLVYLGLIPACSLFYCLLPGQHFYAPYARMEPSALADSRAVEKNITASMQKSYLEHNYATDEWQVARSDIQTSDLVSDSPNSMKFTVSFFATLKRDGKIVASVGGPQVVAELSQEKITTEGRSGWIVCHLVSVPTDHSSGAVPIFNSHLLFRSPEPAWQGDVLCWGVPEEVSFQDLLSGWSGDPKRISGFGLRMLYFSATTITTVGFGDIVPLTTIARIATAVEAIAGWVLAGLFLNSLASRISKNSEEL